MPLKFAEAAGGITHDAMLDWCGRDPEFARALEQARLESVEKKWNLIQKIAAGFGNNPPDWRAAAWSLEPI